ncbi:MAG: sigma-54-dependent Fis family transcriptional regulator [Verrucomicrobiae bacterium]|nr:sigma-54-dependent Fis family transcriptional regulator [Verrucomicrobiae bacterium]
MKKSPKVLIVEDERALALALAATVRHVGAASDLAPTATQARKKLSDTGPYDAMILDIGLPDQNGLAFLESLPERQRPPTFVITAHGEIGNAIAARKLGVREFFSKPLNFEAFVGALTRLLRSVERTAPTPRPSAEDAGRRESAFVGAASSMRAVFQQIAHACASCEAVLIRGETGTGKTHAAQLIRQHSGDADEHVMIVEDVGALSPSEQSNLLRRIEADVGKVPRVLATCGVDLLDAVTRGEFRSDLYYRLQVLEVRLPPLRERIEDLPVLASYFAGQQFPDRLIETSEAALKQLAAHKWPGNLRELRNVISYALTAAAGGSVIDLSHLPDYLRQTPVGDSDTVDKSLTDELRHELGRWVRARLREDPLPTYRDFSESLEGELIRDLLGHFDGKLARLAKELKANRATLRRKLRED